MQEVVGGKTLGVLTSVLKKECFGPLSLQHALTDVAVMGSPELARGAQGNCSPSAI